MRMKYIKSILLFIVFVITIGVIWQIYLSNNSTKEIPKKAKLVKSDIVNYCGVINYRK